MLTSIETFRLIWVFCPQHSCHPEVFQIGRRVLQISAFGNTTRSSGRVSLASKVEPKPRRRVSDDFWRVYWLEMFDTEMKLVTLRHVSLLIVFDGTLVRAHYCTLDLLVQMEEKLTCSPNGFNGDEFIMMKFMVKKLPKAHFEQQTGHVVNVVPFLFNSRQQYHVHVA